MPLEGPGFGHELVSKTTELLGREIVEQEDLLAPEASGRPGQAAGEGQVPPQPLV